MGLWNSRTVNPSNMYQSFNAPYSDLGGEDIESGENRYHNIALPSTSLDLPPLPVGTRYAANDGKVWVYCQAIGSDLVAGQLVTHDAPDAVDDVASSADGLSVLKAGASFVAGFYAGDWMYVDLGTGKTQLRRIVANTTDTLFLDRPLTTALTVAGSSDITMIRYYRALLATTTIADVAGVVVSPIDEDNYGFVQVSGMASVLCEDVSTSVPGGALISDVTTAGQCILLSAGAEDHVFGTSLTLGAADDDQIAVILTGCQWHQI